MTNFGAMDYRILKEIVQHLTQHISNYEILFPIKAKYFKYLTTRN